jgi:hypothetical protein
VEFKGSELEQLQAEMESILREDIWAMKRH